MPVEKPMPKAMARVFSRIRRASITPIPVVTTERSDKRRMATDLGSRNIGYCIRNVSSSPTVKGGC